jgi:hypothetical protein
MQVEVQSRSVKKRMFVEALIPSLLDQLGLNNSRKSVIVSIVRDCDDSGVTTRVTDDLYMVIINVNQSVKDIGLTLAHEFVHVKQFARGQLKTARGRVRWAGKPVKEGLDYLSQPWEVEAFSRQELLLRRALLA